MNFKSIFTMKHRKNVQIGIILLSRYLAHETIDFIK